MAKTYLAKATVELRRPGTIPHEQETRYTLDNTEPNETVGELYTEPFDVYKNTIIKAITYAPGLLPSDVATSTFNVKLPLSENDLVWTSGGDNTDTIAFKCSDELKTKQKEYYPNANVYMSYDGTEPTEETAYKITNTTVSAFQNGVYKFKFIGADNVASDTISVNITTLKCQTPIITVTGTEV